jgi:cell division protein FtsQ
MALIHPEQIEVTGNHNVNRAGIFQIFAADRGKSVLRIPLDRRRQQIEKIAWVEQAVVRRALPNHIEIQITERTPVAFLRDGNDLSMVDAHGVILDRPLSGDFHFPVITGINESMQPDDRDRRVQLYSGFAQQIQSAQPGALDQVSEVDLSDEHDVRATITGLTAAAVPPPTDGTGTPQASTDASVSAAPSGAPILVHFGDGDFAGKFQMLNDNIAQWQATAGSIRSVDLRFGREAVVDADIPANAGKKANVAQKSRPQKPAPVKLSQANGAPAKMTQIKGSQVKGPQAKNLRQETGGRKRSD